MSLQQGTYKLVNVKGGTALDLSGGDNKSIIGFTVHGQGNQQWKVQQNGNSWTFQGVSSGLYISIDGPAQNGQPLVATQNAQVWDIWPDERDQSVFRVFLPNTNFNFDLEDHGNPTPGTKVQLWEKTPGKGQTWRFESV